MLKEWSGCDDAGWWWWLCVCVNSAVIKYPCPNMSMSLCLCPWPSLVGAMSNGNGPNRRCSMGLVSWCFEPRQPQRIIILDGAMH